MTVPSALIAALLLSRVAGIDPAAVLVEENQDVPASPYTMVLGIAQDAGFPQAGCRKDCCRSAWSDEPAPRHVACLAIVDPASGERWLIDATPDLPAQLRALDAAQPTDETPGLAGVLLTHAHIGHYTGLVHVGREVMGARGVPVYAMPRMREFLASNGPWDQLVTLGNIELRPLEADGRVMLNDRIAVTPLLVPHRDEYSETVGFTIVGPRRSVLYIPDIDKWTRWDRRIEELIASVDVAYLDGTFFADGEIPSRNMSDIPHPFIVESMQRFEALPEEERAKIRFIHLNHTNPALQPESAAGRAVESAGMRVASEGEQEPL